MVICIDFLILNFSGFSDFSNRGFFEMESLEKKTRNFQNIFKVLYKGNFIGTLLSDPYDGSVLDKNFKQFQFENSVFYSYKLSDLKNIVFEFLLEYKLDFQGINRLDIALDSVNSTDFFQSFVNDLLAKEKLLSGRKKHFVPYYEFNQGSSVLTGFVVGKRSNSRFLRVYNKSLNLKEVPKQYINDWHAVNGLNGEIWRFEYQLNNKFFSELYRFENDKCEHVFWSIFDEKNLLKLFNLALENHFEIRENTGKSEINKEKKINFFDFSKVKNVLENSKIQIVKIKKSIENKVIGVKRTIKTLFQEYYVSNQLEYEFPITIFNLLNKYDLFAWFERKRNEYLADFREKEKIKYRFDNELLIKHFELCI